MYFVEVVLATTLGCDRGNNRFSLGVHGYVLVRARDLVVHGKGMPVEMAFN